ncbi:glycosyltransferase family 4 protein [Rubripirellula sp.]|nr:glycosyltransferase family 4 protein [Rubripirellula sp.]
MSEVYPPASGGSGRWFSEVYPHMTECGCIAVTHQHLGWQHYDNQQTAIDVHRENLFMTDRAPGSISSLLRYHSIFRTVKRIARTQGITQIHAARPLHEGLVARFVSRSLKVPFLCYVHGEDLSIALTSRQLRFATKFILQAAGTIISNSEFTRTLLLENFPVNQNRVQVIHPGVDTNFFRPAAECPTTRNRLGWGGRKVMLTVGRLQTRKGQDNAIRAISKIRESHPNILYAIVGEGSYGTELRRLVKHEGVEKNVVFHGEVTDTEMLACYQQCDLFCLPNRADGADVEGFGMVSLEAQSCGKPSLVGDSGGTPETISEGKTGFAIDCTNTDLIAQRAIELLKEPNALAQFGANARTRAVEQFDWKEIVRRSEQLFIHIEQGG